MGKRSRDKGAAFERAIAITLRSVWDAAKRGIGQARAGGEVADVEGTPYWIECKHRRRVSVQGAFVQATEATDGRPPVVISRENRGPLLVTMGLSDWLDLVERNR